MERWSGKSRNVITKVIQNTLNIWSFACATKKTLKTQLLQKTCFWNTCYWKAQLLKVLQIIVQIDVLCLQSTAQNTKKTCPKQEPSPYKIHAISDTRNHPENMTQKSNKNHLWAIIIRPTFPFFSGPKFELLCESRLGLLSLLCGIILCEPHCQSRFWNPTPLPVRLKFSGFFSGCLCFPCCKATTTGEEGCCFFWKFWAIDSQKMGFARVVMSA